MTDPIGTAQERELIERALALREECRIGVEERGVMPNYVDACVTLKALAPKLLDVLLSRIAEVERLTARVNELEAEMQCECGGKMLMAHNHPCPTYGAALSQHRKL